MWNFTKNQNFYNTYKFLLSELKKQLVSDRILTQIIILFFLIELKSKFCPKDKRKNGKYFTKKNVSGLNCTYYFKTTPIIRASRRRINSKIRLKAFARKPFEKSNITNFGDGRKFCHICFDYANEYYEHMIGNDISNIFRNVLQIYFLK